MISCPICLASGEFKEVIAVAKLYHVGKKLIRHKCSKCGAIFGTQEMLGLSFADLGKRYKELYNSGYREGATTEYEMAIVKLSNKGRILLGRRIFKQNRKYRPYTWLRSD
jgi:hypothetical protein